MSDQPQQSTPRLQKKKSVPEQLADAAKGAYNTVKRKVSGGLGKNTPRRAGSGSDVPPLPTAPVASSSTAVQQPAPTAHAQAHPHATQTTAAPAAEVDRHIKRFSELERIAATESSTPAHSGDARPSSAARPVRSATRLPDEVPPRYSEEVPIKPVGLLLFCCRQTTS